MTGLILLCALAVSNPNPYANKSFYSRNNVYQGKVSSQGNIYNRYNVYKGNIRSNGSIYNRSNIYQGRIK